MREEEKVASSLQLAPWRLQLHLRTDTSCPRRTLWNGYLSHGALRHQLLCLWVRPAGRWGFGIWLPEKAHAGGSLDPVLPGEAPGHQSICRSKGVICGWCLHACRVAGRNRVAVRDGVEGRLRMRPDLGPLTLQPLQLLYKKICFHFELLFSLEERILLYKKQKKKNI